VSANEASVARSNYQRTVEREVGLDDGALRRTRTETMVLCEGGPRRVGDPAACGEHARGLHLERGPQLVDLGEITGGERPNEDAAVARLDEQAPAHQSVERSAKRVPPDVELLGKRDLTEMLAGLEAAVEHLALERILERLDA
jgi:hypothetical protein